MATENQGIMSLPQGGEKEGPQAPQMGLDESYDAVKGGLQDASPQASAAFQQAMDQIMPQLDQLPDEQLDMLLQAFQYIHDHPEQYKQLVKELIDGGVLEEGMLPEEYDPEIISVLIMVFLEARKQRQAGNQREAQMGMPQPPATMARGGIADAARMVASSGRGGDTMLAHINRDEAKLLKKRGGAGTINPATGLPEYGWNPIKSVVNAVSSAVSGVVGAVKSVVNSVVSTVKSIVQSPVGKILGTIALATVLGPTALGATLGTAGTAALSAGTITALGGGNLKDVLRSAATSYLGAPGGPVENFIGNAGAAIGVTNAAGQAAINAGITGAGVGLLTGQSLKDSVKSGLIAGAIQGGITGASKGFGAQVPGMANAPTGDTSGKWNPETGKFETTPLTPGKVADQINTKDFDQFKATKDQYGAFGEAPTGGAGGQQASAAAGKLQPVPTIGDSASRIGGGLSDIAQGNFGKGFEGVKGGLGDLLMPSKYTPEQLTTTDTFQNARANGASYTEAIKAASDAYNPGMLRTYGPGIAAGLAATGAMGGFKPGTLPPSAMAEKLSGTPGEDLIKANPSKYITQNLPGVEYDASGNIIGSKPWSPSATMADVRVPANSMGGGQYNFGSVQPPMGAMYTPGMGTLGQSPQVYQPYNTADMYSNLMYPRRAAEGGIMDIHEPVQHLGWGGMLRSVVNSVRNIINPSSQPAAPAAAAAPVAAVTPAAAPAAAAQVAAPQQVAGPAPQIPPQLAAQLAQASPGGMPAAAPAPNPMDQVRAAPTHFMSRMTPEMQAAFAQRFGQNMQFDPQAMQQAQMARVAPQQEYNTRGMYNFGPQQQPPMYNMGRPMGQGLASLAEGGYPRRTGQISGPGTEKSDSIPAMLSDGEFVMTAKAVRGAGKGSRRAGAKKMYALMHQLERNASRG